MRERLKKITPRDWAIIIGATLLNLVVPLYVLSLGYEMEEFTALGYVGVFIANTVSGLAPFSPIPAALVSFVVGNILDPIAVILISAVAVALGEYVFFLFGDSVDDLVAKTRWHNTFKKWFNKAPFLFLVIWVAIPNPVQTFGVAIIGTAKFPKWKYFAASIIGHVIWFAMVVWAGMWFFDLVKLDL